MGGQLPPDQGASAGGVPYMAWRQEAYEQGKSNRQKQKRSEESTRAMLAERLKTLWMRIRENA